MQNRLKFVTSLFSFVLFHRIYCPSYDYTQTLRNERYPIPVEKGPDCFLRSHFTQISFDVLFSLKQSDTPRTWDIKHWRNVQYLLHAHLQVIFPVANPARLPLTHLNIGGVMLLTCLGLISVPQNLCRISPTLRSEREWHAWCTHSRYHFYATGPEHCWIFCLKSDRYHQTARQDRTHAFSKPPCRIWSQTAAETQLRRVIQCSRCNPCRRIYWDSLRDVDRAKRPAKQMLIWNKTKYRAKHWLASH